MLKGLNVIEDFYSRGDSFYSSADRAKLESIYRGCPYPWFCSVFDVRLFHEGKEHLLNRSQSWDFLMEICSFCNLNRILCSEELASKLSDFLADQASIYYYQKVKV